MDLSNISSCLFEFLFDKINTKIVLTLKCPHEYNITTICSSFVTSRLNKLFAYRITLYTNMLSISDFKMIVKDAFFFSNGNL